MELTLKEIVNANQAIEKMAQKKNLKAKILYWITVTQRKLLPSQEAFMKARQQSLFRYAKADPADESGMKFKFGDDESRDKFNKEVEELLTQTETHEINTIKFSVLYGDKALELTPDQITLLGPLVEMDEIKED
jgi:uncharacterized protein YjaZ